MTFCYYFRKSDEVRLAVAEVPELALEDLQQRTEQVRIFASIYILYINYKYAIAGG